MARVTVEDCIEKVEDRFELVMLAAQRARKIGSGSPLTVERDNDKNPVVALREIADETVNTADLKEDLVRSHQRVILSDEEDRKMIELEDHSDSETLERNEPVKGMYSDDEISDADDMDDDDDDLDTIEEMAGEL